MTDKDDKPTTVWQNNFLRWQTEIEIINRIVEQCWYVTIHVHVHKLM